MVEQGRQAAAGPGRPWLAARLEGQAAWGSPSFLLSTSLTPGMGEGRELALGWEEAQGGLASVTC